MQALVDRNISKEGVMWGDSPIYGLSAAQTKLTLGEFLKGCGYFTVLFLGGFYMPLTTCVVILLVMASNHLIYGNR